MLPRLFVVVLLLALVAAADPVVAPPPIISAAEWGSTPQTMPTTKRHTPRFITIHHAGELWKPADDPVKKIKGLQIYGQNQKHWEDVPYHYLIAPDGRILEGRSLEYMPESNTNYALDGHVGIMLWGNFMVQRATREQLESCAKLTAWLCFKLKINPSQIATHKDRAQGQTDCPGVDFYRYVEDGTFEGWVKEILAGQKPSIALKAPLPGGPTTMTGAALPSTLESK